MEEKSGKQKMTTLKNPPVPKNKEDEGVNLVIMSTDQKRAMAGVYTNHLILSEIFDHLPIAQLKECRLVNPIWKKLSSNTILRNDACTTKLVLEGCESDLTLLNTWYESEDWENDENVDPQSSYEDHPLKSLNQILTNNPDFPCTHLTLYCDGHTCALDYDGWTDEKKMARKVTLFQLDGGEHFKTLRIRVEADCHYILPLKLFAELMTTKLVNVEKMVAIENIIFGTEDETKNLEMLEPFFLPSLKFIKFNGFNEGITRAAINLKEIVICDEYVDSKILKVLQECFKSAVLRTYEHIYVGDAGYDDDDEIDGDGWCEKRWRYTI